MPKLRILLFDDVQKKYDFLPEIVSQLNQQPPSRRGGFEFEAEIMSVEELLGMTADEIVRASRSDDAVFLIDLKFAEHADSFSNLSEAICEQMGSDESFRKSREESSLIADPEDRKQYEFSATLLALCKTQGTKVLVVSTLAPSGVVDEVRISFGLHHAVYPASDRASYNVKTVVDEILYLAIPSDAGAILASLRLGSSNAEAEAKAKELKEFFVHAPAWDSVIKGEFDLILGSKGTGKSTFYQRLLQESESFLRKETSIVIIGADDIRGKGVFDTEFAIREIADGRYRLFWKLYFVFRLAEHFRVENYHSPVARRVQKKLQKAGVRFRDENAFEKTMLFFRAIGKRGIVFDFTIDPTTGQPTGFSTKMTARPTNDQASRLQALTNQVDELLNDCDQALHDVGRVAWICVDRLDVIFQDDRESEQRAITALLHTYNDIKSRSSAIILKLFLRSDLWHKLELRNADHLADKIIRLRWSEESLRALMIRRLAASERVQRVYGFTKQELEVQADRQRAFLEELFCSTVAGDETFEVILNSLADSSGLPTARNIVIFLKKVTQIQRELIDTGDLDPAGKLFSAKAVQKAVAAAAEDALNMSILAENKGYKKLIMRLREQDGPIDIKVLSTLWNAEESDDVHAWADDLKAIGVLQEKTTEETQYEVVPIMRTAFRGT